LAELEEGRWVDFGI
jgi:hypothetical protein